MDIQIKEENGNLICLKHNEKVIMFVMDQQVLFKDALICQQCIQEKPTVSNKIFGICQLQKMISEKYAEQENKLEHEKQIFLESLYQLSSNIMNYKNKVIKQADVITNNLSEWITEIQRTSLPTLNLIQQLQLLHSNQESMPFTPKIDTARLVKLLQSFQKLFAKDELVACNEKIKLIEKNIQSCIIRQQKQNIQISVPKKAEHINSVKQDDACRAIAFNQTGQIMVAGCGRNIKVWEFDKGKLRELKTLIGHTDLVFCLVYSRKLNWFVSGSQDTKIRLWQEKQNEWMSSQPQKQHSDKVYCMVLNNKENQLFSCGADKKIIVWKVDSDLVYEYTLEKKHTNIISSISLNLSETALVSCSLDQTIILWMKGLNQKWEYINNIKATFGLRLCFISDTYFLFQPETQSQTQIFEIENKQIIEKQHLMINLPGAYNDFFLFPTIYNKTRQIILQKHNKYIYLIKFDGTFKIALGPIDCYHWETFGTLTEDGEYLIFWNSKTQEFKVFQIYY